MVEEGAQEIFVTTELGGYGGPASLTETAMDDVNSMQTSTVNVLENHFLRIVIPRG